MSQNQSETIVIRAEPIELSQLLKFAGIFGSGGEAKYAINGGQVTVNGVVEKQARKKILGGQTVVIGERTLLVKLGAAGAVKVKPAAKPKIKAPVTGGQAQQARPAAGGREAGPAKANAKPDGGASYGGRQEREEKPAREKTGGPGTGQRTFFYTELLKAKQQSKRRKRTEE